MIFESIELPFLDVLKFILMCPVLNFAMIRVDKWNYVLYTQDLNKKFTFWFIGEMDFSGDL